MSDRTTLRARYGFDFPDDVLALWDLARRLRPKKPRYGLSRGPLEVGLEGPFLVLSGEADRLPPERSMILQNRRPLDPPEQFNFAWGGDGLRWGYFCDDPARGPSCVAAGFPGGFLQPVGATAIEAMRDKLERTVVARREHLEMFPDDEPDYHRQRLDELAALREELQAYGTADRSETGADYLSTYDATLARRAAIVAETSDGMGIVADRGAWSHLDEPPAQLEHRAQTPAGLAAVVARADAALAAGHAVTALALGKALWYTRHDGDEHGLRVDAAARDLSIRAYQALERPLLAEVVRAHAPHRRTPAAIDLLPDED